MSECLMTIMSATAQYSHRTGVEVSFVRDENKKEACGEAERRASKVDSDRAMTIHKPRGASTVLMKP